MAKDNYFQKTIILIFMFISYTECQPYAKDIIEDVEIIGNISSQEKSNKIMNGSVAENNQFPFVVSIQTYSIGQHICGGTLITTHHVLTAAHCMFIKPPDKPFLVDNLQVRVGPIDLKLPGIVVAKLQWIKIHERYRERPIDNDIAVIKATTALSSAENEFPRLSTHFITFEIFQEPCIAVGWGRLGPDLLEKQPNATTFNSTMLNYNSDLNEEVVNSHYFHFNNQILDFNSTIFHNEKSNFKSERRDLLLRYTFLPLQNWTECAKDYSMAGLTNEIICAGERNSGTDTCKGDSGGPLICNNTIEGIVSFGDGCDKPEHLGVYTRVYTHQMWIQDQINSGSLQFKFKFIVQLILGSIIYLSITK